MCFRCTHCLPLVVNPAEFTGVPERGWPREEGPSQAVGEDGATRHAAWGGAHERAGEGRSCWSDTPTVRGSVTVWVHSQHSEGQCHCIDTLAQ